MIKNFSQFNESSDQDFKLCDLLSTLTRFYETNKSFYTDELQFLVDEEHRKWEDMRTSAKLEENTPEKGVYILKFRLNEKKHVLELKFNFEFSGNTEKDAPETAPEKDLNRLNVALENIDVKSVSIESHTFNYNSSSLSATVEKSCEKFLIKVMSSDYDTLGEKLYSVEQQ